MGDRLSHSFYARPAPEVAPDLLGKCFVRRLGERCLSGRIVEVEAYTGNTDPASHAYRGKTPRNAVMFGPAGHLYVYLSYGMHSCMNVVTDDPGRAGAVLIRALEPREGLDIMEARRGGKPLVDFCNGPGKLCAALGITREQNGTDLTGDEIWIEDEKGPTKGIGVSARVGISTGVELPLRFFLLGNRFVSRGRPAMPPASP
ncbi:MAG: DNA-3-methyladenine glycosylase [Chloroflexota bacterium]